MAHAKYGRISKHDWLIGCGITLIAVGVMLWRLGFPDALVFDETHYVPAGRDFFSSGQWTNNSHPPFAKWIIGLSSYISSDSSFGWRLPGAVLGALCVTSVYAGMRLFGFKLIVAGFAALLTILNQTLLVQAQTAMLDVYALGLFMLSTLAAIWSGKRVRTRRGASAGLVVSGILLGLATASKWSAGIDMFLVWGGILIWRFTESSPKGIFFPRFFSSGFAGWNQFSLLGAALRQGVPALAVYLLTFVPFLYMEGDWSLVTLHQNMFADVAGNLKPHPYASDWWEWPIMLEPIWYYFEKGDDGFTHAIFLIGNPAIYWAGLPPMLACLGYGVTRKDGALLAISGAYMGFWLIYAVLPRDLMFSYYYEPAAIMLGMGIAAFVARFVRREMQLIVMSVWGGVALGFFVFFYPVLTAMPFEGEEWLRWRWFSIWS